ncbi:MAG: hypothetical protein ACRDRE_15655 [Pseudonocardiaceae bacterium]
MATLADKTTPRPWLRFVIVEIRFILAALHGVLDHVIDALRAVQGTVALTPRWAKRRRQARRGHPPAAHCAPRCPAPARSPPTHQDRRSHPDRVHHQPVTLVPRLHHDISYVSSPLVARFLVWGSPRPFPALHNRGERPINWPWGDQRSTVQSVAGRDERGAQ